MGQRITLRGSAAQALVDALRKSVEASKPKISSCCGAPFVRDSEMCYPHDGIVGQCSRCMEMSEEQNLLHVRESDGDNLQPAQLA